MRGEFSGRAELPPAHQPDRDQSSSRRGAETAVGYEQHPGGRHQPREDVARWLGRTAIASETASSSKEQEPVADPAQRPGDRVTTRDGASPLAKLGELAVDDGWGPELATGIPSEKTPEQSDGARTTDTPPTSTEREPTDLESDS